MIFLWLSGMEAVSRAAGQKVGIVKSGLNDNGGQHKAVAGVHRGMFPVTKVGDHF
jgi:hypothetical protein